MSMLKSGGPGSGPNPPNPTYNFDMSMIDMQNMQSVIKSVIYDLISNAIVESVRNRELTLGDMNTIQENIFTSLVKNTAYRIALKPYIDKFIMASGVDQSSVEFARFASEVIAGFVSRFLVIRIQGRTKMASSIFFEALYGQIGSYVIDHLLRGP